VYKHVRNIINNTKGEVLRANLEEIK